MSQSICPEPDSLRDQAIEGMTGHHIAQQLVGLQAGKRVLDRAHIWAERANRIGWANAGIDVNQIDEDMGTEDVDSSINMSGDTHIHIGATDEQSKPAPTPKPQPAPQQPPAQPQPAPTPSNQVWRTIAAVTLGTLLAGGTGAGIGYLLRDPAPPVDTGGASFDFDTQLPPFMQDGE